jgi:hypothetical protein
LPRKEKWKLSVIATKQKMGVTQGTAKKGI